MSLKKPNILVYSPLSLKLRGGGERWLSEVLPRLQDSGFQIHLITTDFLPKGYISQNIDFIVEKLSRANIKMTELGTVKLSSKLPILTFRSWRKLVEEMRKSDILYFLNAYAFQDLSIFVAKILAGTTPVVCSQHATLIHSDRIHNIYTSSFTKFLLSRFDAVHVLNPEDWELAHEWGAERLYLIPNGVDSARFQPTDHRTASDRFRVLFVGRLDHQKGVDTLLEAIEYLNGFEQSTQFEFIICGIGPLEDEVLSFAQSHTNLQYLGFVSDDDLSKIYCSADLFIMPSREETFGLVAMEALASGVPVIASDIPGPRMFVDDRVGQLIRPGNPMALALAILDQYSEFRYHPTNYLQKRKESVTRATNEYDWNIVTEKMKTMFLDTIRSHRMTR